MAMSSDEHRPTQESCLGREDLGRLWQELTTGLSRVVDNYCTEEHYVLHIETRFPDPSRPAQTLEDLDILEQFLLGKAQKTLALDCCRSDSLIASILQRRLLALGIDATGREVPASLVMLAHARHRRGIEFRAQGRMLVIPGGASICEVRIERPDRFLSEILSRCEYLTIRSVLEGKSHAEIAQLRGTSLRTIANQVASTYSKLGTSGRQAILCSVLAGDAQRSPLATRVRATAHSRRRHGERRARTSDQTCAPSSQRPRTQTQKNQHFGE